MFAELAILWLLIGAITHGIKLSRCGNLEDVSKYMITVVKGVFGLYEELFGPNEEDKKNG